MPEATQRKLSPQTTITTAIPDLRLIALSPDDAETYYDLVDRNRGHLTQHGDWTELGEATPESVAASLNNFNDPATQFGIWFDGQLVGRADLNPRTLGNFVLGYWLGGEYTGKGYATAACKALIAHGKVELGASAIYAGVTKGNAKSEAVLRRLGFQAVADLGTYTRFKLPLVQGGQLVPEQTMKSEARRALIRPAIASEADAVRALVRAAYGRWIERFAREPSPMRDDYTRRIADGQVWVLEDEGKLVGLVVLRGGPEALLIPNVAVAPAAQGKGYGRRLIAFAESEARRRDCRDIRLFVNALMVENVAFYRHLGFVEIERIGEAGDRVYFCMAKPVS